jgi:hypothetical protein
MVSYKEITIRRPAMDESSKPKLLILCRKEKILFEQIKLDTLRKMFRVILTHHGIDALRALRRDDEIGLVLAAHAIANDLTTEFYVEEIKRKFPGIQLIGLAGSISHPDLVEWGCAAVTEPGNVLETLQARDMVWKRPGINPS